MDVTAFSISKHLSDLVGRNVAVKLNEANGFSEQIRSACYTVEPFQGNAVVQLDFHLLAYLSGTMLGIPALEIESQVRTGQLDENLTDAARELMNVLSAVIVSEGRAIFKGLFKRASEYSTKAEDLVRSGSFPLRLLVTPSGGKPGCMVIISDVA